MLEDPALPIQEVMPGVAQTALIPAAGLGRSSCGGTRSASRLAAAEFARQLEATGRGGRDAEA